ncbi:MAG: 30S ribosomal protein S17 [Planctomycetota bacterium]|nr:30S ribosomal protein S17 [Planctomycetota bacterium]
MQESKLKTLTAAVVSKSGDKSVTVAVDYKVKHPKYGKYMKRRTKLAVHDEHNQSGVGDVIEIAQCKPCSKRKSWRLLKIVQKVEQA